MRTKLILKFGGSSLADADCFRRVLEIIRSRLGENPIVVASAVGTSKAHQIKVTDQLRNICLKAMSGKESTDLMESLRDRHMALIRELGLADSIIDSEMDDLGATIQKVTSGKAGQEEEALDSIMGWGEIFSAKILTALLCSEGHHFETAHPEDFSFITDDNFQNANILDSSLESIASRVIASKSLLVFPGYIGITADRRRTTLGRGGSDYTAAILGAALKRDVEIWTDVNGIYRIAPHYLPPQFQAAGHPHTIPELSYEEAFQMAAFGSRVLYEKTLLAVHQAVKKGKHIQLHIRSVFS